MDAVPSTSPAPMSSTYNSKLESLKGANRDVIT